MKKAFQGYMYHTVVSVSAYFTYSNIGIRSTGKIWYWWNSSIPIGYGPGGGGGGGGGGQE